VLIFGGWLRLEDMRSFDGITGVALDSSHSTTCTGVEACCVRAVLMQSASGLWCCTVVTGVGLVAL
jgi:hypothetical protein